MKKLMNKYVVMIMAVSLVFTGCKDYLDVNTDPNNPDDASIDLVLPAGMASIGIQVGGSYHNLGGFWSQYYTQSPDAGQYENFDEYNITSDEFDREWTDLFAGGLNDLQTVRNKAKADGEGSYHLIATAMQCYGFHFLADLYNDIPYSEAFGGLDGNFNPKFDNGTTIYPALLAALDDALDYYAANPGRTPGNNDLVYGGNMAQWVGFANTLKLRMLMRASATSQGNMQAIKDLVAANNFITADAKMTSFADEQAKRNPYYEIQVDRLGGVNQAASNSIIKYLVDNSDPRIENYFVIGSTGQWVAKEQGDFANRDIPMGELAQPNMMATSPVYFFTVSEVNFLIAEANLRFNGGAGAQAAYEAGIQASFDMLGASGGPATYGSGGAYEWNSGGTTDEQWAQIMTQKWVAMCNSQNLEAFFERNRTGYPVYATAGTVGNPGELTVSIASVLSTGGGPQRLLVPDVEVARNTNAPAQPAGGIGEKVWWAK
jgi:hypothetical protein